MDADTRALLRAAVDARRRVLLADSTDGLDARCGGSASEATYKAGCRCVDCRAVATSKRRARRLADPGSAAREAARSHERRLRRKIERVAAGYLIDGADADDAKQVAMIAVEEAKANYNPTLGVPFEAFAVEVAKRRLHDAQSAAGRHKHRVLTASVRTTGNADGEETPVLELLPDLTPDPYEVVVHRLELAAIIAALPSLTELERVALRWVLNGESYAGSREVDNAIQRARRKLRSVANAA